MRIIILILILALCGTVTVYAGDDSPTSQFIAFKSEQPETYNTTLEIAEKYNVDEYALFALMYRETRYRTNLQNHNTNGTTDTGIMQINSCNWQWLADAGIDVHTTHGNIEGAAYMLSMFMEKYTERQAIAAYGAGEGGMLAGRGFTQADELYLIIDELKQA